MKKILFVANVAKEHIMKFHLPQMRVFREHGWQVDVACAGEETIPHCDHQFHASWKRSPFTPKTFKGIKELTKIINDHQYDIVYCHTPVGGLVARLAARKARKNGTKVIYCAHGLHFFKGAPLINWLLFYPIEKWLAHYTDVFFAINKEDYERVKHRLNKKMDVHLTNGVGVNFERLQIANREATRAQYRKTLGISEKAPVLIYVAEIIKNKNQKMLVDTVRILKEQFPDIMLLLVGPKHDDGALQAYIQNQNLSDHVKLLGWKSDIGEWMVTADISVASSIREGFPVNPLEAMYCGLPVVATNNRGHVTGIRHGENGFLVDLDDSEAMAQYVTKLLTDPTLYKQMSTVDVSRYDCDRIAEELFTLITTCTN